MKKNATDNQKTNLTKKTSLTVERERKKCEEEFFQLILSDEEPEDADYWLQKAEELAKDPNRAPTSEQRAAFEKRLSREVKVIQSQKRIKARTAGRRKKAPQIGRRLAMVAIFLTVTISTTLYYKVDAFAVGVDNFISTIFPRAQELRITEGNGSDIEFDPDDFEGMYVPDWIPKGFDILEIEGELFPKRVCYSNKEGETLWFFIYNDESSLCLDDEDVDIQRVFVHDSWGKIIVKENYTRVVWEDGIYLYMVCGDYELQDDLIEMMQKSKKVFMEE